MTNYGKIDILWYVVAWPLDALGTVDRTWGSTIDPPWRASSSSVNAVRRPPGPASA